MEVSPFWSVPAGSPPLEDVNVFNTVLLDHLLEKQLFTVRDFNIVDLFVTTTLFNLETIRRYLHGKCLTIEAYHGIIRPLCKDEGLKMAQEIAAMRPDSMLWSNVLDYMELEEFHDVARCCSVSGNTVHYGYSMNWPTEVFGLNILDYKGESEISRSTTRNILDSSLGSEVRDRAGNSYMTTLLTIPFFDTPLNITTYHLAGQLYSKWTDHFAAKAAASLEGMRRKSLGDQTWPKVMRAIQAGNLTTEVYA